MFKKHFISRYSIFCTFIKLHILFIMINKFILFFIFLILVGCKEYSNNINITLDRAEEYLSQNPDSALLVLNSLNIEDLIRKKIRARYALLKSIALDKNYIDVTKDSLTSIAVEYYSKKGSADEKLKAYMYNGRVLVNAGEYEKAMDSYIIAEEYVPDCKDLIYNGLLYNCKGMVYTKIYDYEKAVQQFKLSSEFYVNANDTTRYLGAMNNIALALMMSNSQSSNDFYFTVMEQYWKKLTLRQKSNYYAYKLISTKEPKKLLNEIDLYINDIEYRSLINWLVVAQSYIKIEDYTKAEEALQSYKLYNKNINDTFYYLLSTIEYKRGNYKAAFENLNKYNTYLDKVAIKNTKSDTRFLEERYIAREKASAQRYYIVLLCLGILITFILIVVLYLFIKNIRFRHKQKELRMQKEIEQYQNKYNEAVIEHERLRKLLKKSKYSINLPEAVKLSLNNRLNVLNSYIVSNISGLYSDKAAEELKALLDDKDTFIKSMGDSFMISYPKFIEYLQKHNLNEWEIGCCCLYCLGLNGSEISTYLNQNTYYFKKIGVLRNKLGLDRSINIDTFLRKLLIKYCN